MYIGAELDGDAGPAAAGALESHLSLAAPKDAWEKVLALNQLARSI